MGWVGEEKIGDTEVADAVEIVRLDGVEGEEEFGKVVAGSAEGGEFAGEG